MKRVKFLAAILPLTVMALPARADAAAPLTFKPATSWVADFATENCALRRGFQNDGKVLYLELNSFTYGDGFQVRVYGPGLSLRSKPPKTRFEPDTLFDEQSTWVRANFVDGNKGILYKDTIFPNTKLKPFSDEAIAQLRALMQDYAGRDRREREITGLLIKDAFAEDVLLQTGSLHAPMEMMRKCLADLAGTEGLDPVKIATLSRSVVPKGQMQWARELQKNYPDDMVRKGRSAAVDIRMIVDEDGMPISCKTRDNGQGESFTSAACEGMMKFSRFDPALDADGHPVKGYFTTSIIYRVF